MSTKSELRLTDTNAASDSKGRTWGHHRGPQGRAGFAADETAFAR